jgi:GR25 family glycosyltransferase involved in LPS biosynthesis
MPIVDILTFFSDPKAHGDHPPVFLSGARYDALYAGFPLVHSSPTLKEQGVGHYYSGIAEAVEAIRKVPTATEARKFLATKDPYSVDTVAAIKRLLDQPIKRIALPAEGAIKNTVTYSAGSQIKGVSKAFVVNLDRRADRYALFQKNHPSFSGAVTRVSAVDGKQLKLTSDLVHLFRGNDFNWLKGIMGCALSHYNLWKQLAESATDTSYLLFEDDVVCPPDFVEKVNHYIRHMPADTDVLYLGGVLPANKQLFDTVVEPVNEHIGRIKLRADTGTRFFHFGAYSYILTKRGAKALMDYIGEHGIYQAIDMILCRRYKTMNLYFSLPHLCTITQYDDPSFATSSFNDVANQNVYDSDIANTKDRFTEEEVRAASVQILVVSACDKRKAILEQQFKALEIPFPIQYLEAKTLDAEAAGYVPDNVTTVERRSILSTRSHIRAVEIAGHETSPLFTLIMEDDVALHTTEFKATILRIMETYDTTVAPHSGILSLGWIPCNNYSFYSQLTNPTVLNASYTIHQRFTPGTQAYLIKRSKAAEFTPLFKHATHRALCNAILAKEHPMIAKESQITVFDDFGTKLLEQCILFPPLVIEQPNTSLIRDTVENPYWAQFFKGHEEARDRYWKVKPNSKFQDAMKPLLITYDNKPTDATRFFQKTLDANGWEHALIGEGEMWEGLQFSKRVLAYYNYIQTLPDEKIVVLSDARDVLCVRSPTAFIDGFRSFGKDIVTSMELSWNSKIAVPSDYFPQDASRLLQYWKHQAAPVRRYVNMGLVAGTVKALKHCLPWVYAAMKTTTVPECDQYSFANYMNTFPERVAADTGAILLHTTNGGLNAGILDIHVQKDDFPTFAELFGRSAFFLHIPGSGGKNGQGVLYNQVCKGIELGMCSKTLIDPYGYKEPAWNEVF